MLSHLFLGLSLLGAEWVLYFLIFLSVYSVALMFERSGFYKNASRGIEEFRKQLRDAVSSGEWDRAVQLAQNRTKNQATGAIDLEASMSLALLNARKDTIAKTDILTEIASDHVMRARVKWEKNLSVLATIGNNAPFIGLFGTVLGIIKAFHDLSQQAASGVSGVTAGISEALIATAVGILVAIPAVVAFNLYQRRNKVALNEAEALKSFLVGKIAGAK